MEARWSLWLCFPDIVIPNGRVKGYLRMRVTAGRLMQLHSEVDLPVVPVSLTSYSDTFLGFSQFGCVGICRDMSHKARDRVAGDQRQNKTKQGIEWLVINIKIKQNK